MTQSIEETFHSVQATTAYVASSAGVAAALEDAVRDGYLAVLRDMDLPCCGVIDEDDLAWCGDPFCLQAADLRRRIEELGR